MDIRKHILPIALALFFAAGVCAGPAAAQPTPGSACLAGQAGHVTQTGGGGAGALMICENLVWRPIIGFNAQGNITAIGNQTCDNGQTLSYNGTQWVCADSGGIESISGLSAPPSSVSCTQRNSGGANNGTRTMSCNAGETMTGGGCYATANNLRTSRPSAAATWECVFTDAQANNAAYAICCVF